MSEPVRDPAIRLASGKNTPVKITDVASAAERLDQVLARVLAEICALDSQTRLDQRYEKFRRMGKLGVDFVEEGE